MGVLMSVPAHQLSIQNEESVQLPTISHQRIVQIPLISAMMIHNARGETSVVQQGVFKSVSLLQLKRSPANVL